MKVTYRMMAPELRPAAWFIRTFLPSFATAVRLQRKLKKPIRRPHAGGVDVFLPRPDGTSLRIRLHRPAKPVEGAPALLWLHGGGYALGTPEQDEVFIRRFVAASGCVVAAPDYALSIEKPYPAALEDAHRALVWLARQAAAFGADAGRLFVGGDSAGGGLALALALYERDHGGPRIAFLMPLYPMIDDRMRTPSMIDNDAPLWNEPSNRFAWSLYLGERFGTDDVPADAAPARAEDLQGLPPTATFVGSLDPFRDETVDFMKRLEAAGTWTRLKVCDGGFHAFDLACPRSRIAREAIAFLMDQYRYAVERFRVTPR